MNSKQKGASFERLLAKELSLWITNGEKTDCFWRSAMSGGRATVAHKRGEVLRQSGDLTGVSPEGHKFLENLYIEIKHLQEINVFGILTNRGDFISIWKQVCREAAKYDKAPVFIVKQNMRPSILCTNVTGLWILGFQPRVSLNDGTVMQLLDVILSEPYRPMNMGQAPKTTRIVSEPKGRIKL